LLDYVEEKFKIPQLIVGDFNYSNIERWVANELLETEGCFCYIFSVTKATIFYFCK